MSDLSEGPPFVVNTFQWRKDEREEFLTTEPGARSYGSKKPVHVLTSRQTGGEGARPNAVGWAGWVARHH